MSPSLDRLARNVLAWLVPALLSAAVSVLWGIQGELKRISESLAVAMVKIDLMERRIDSQESRMIGIEKNYEHRPRP